MTTPEETIPEVQRLPGPLRLEDAKLLLSNDYLPLESGFAYDANGMLHVAAVIYMPNCSAEMIDWWFGWIHTTEQYKLWHPRDHVFSDWEGPRNNDSTYVGGSHLVHEYHGGELVQLKISFRDPDEYFGSMWKEDFARFGYQIAVCARVGKWDPTADTVQYIGHLIHLVRDEPGGCWMKSRFWLGDIESVMDPGQRGANAPITTARHLLKHGTEEMSILATFLPEFYERYRRRES